MVCQIGKLDRKQTLWTAQIERLAFVKLSQACVSVSHGLWPVILTRASDCLSSGARLDGP